MSEKQPEPSYLEHRGQRLAYQQRAGSSPTLLFLPGYASDMDGAKAVAIDAFAGRRGVSVLRFDYSGTGSSGGDFADGTLAGWIDEAIAMAERLTEGPIVLVGSSMGGWIALHVALRLRERIQALVGIAAAPDFTDWGFTAEQKKELVANGKFEWQDRYGDGPKITTRAFWESGEELRLLGGPIAVECPVRLIHGETDRTVPVGIARELMRQLRSADVQLNILKGGGHRLSEPREIEAIIRTVAALLEPVP